MIRELDLWRQKLASYADDLDTACRDPWDNSEARVFCLEHTLLVSASTARRMYEAQVVSFDLHGMSLEVAEFSSNGGPVDTRRRNSLMACFDMSRPRLQLTSAFDIYNAVRHSFLLHFGFSQEDGQSFFFATDREKTRLRQCRFSRYSDTLRSLSEDYYFSSVSYPKKTVMEEVILNSRSEFVDSEEHKAFFYAHKLREEYEKHAQRFGWEPWSHRRRK